ncbi:MAG: large-conductance mechanosensitive channel protein MscL [Gemmataceae bacterium]|nr:large-conductance mechanosensitive channel protein MscL [Gemmataceae bacterium]
MRSFLEEFRKFVLRGNVVDLAVGIVIGAAFGKIVDSLVADVFMPIIGVLTGGLNVAALALPLYGDAQLRYGAFLQTVLNFVVIGFCLFLVVKGMNRLRDHFDWLEADKPPTVTTPTEKLLAEIRDLLRDRAADRPPAGPPA